MINEAYSWQPGGPDTEVEQLRSEIARLRRKVERLEKGALDTHWHINPDRSGGAFTQEEIGDKILTSAPTTPEPDAWRITDGEGDYTYRTDEPSDSMLKYAAKYGRKYEPLYLLKT